MNVNYGNQGFRLAAIIEKRESANEITCILRETGKKEISLDGNAYTRFSDHIGKFPAVMIAPDDVQIITGGSEERRRFIDALFSQLDHDYLLQLISYNKILAQRNSLLKLFAETRRVDLSLLEVVDKQLAIPGTLVSEKRRNFLVDIIPLVREFYQKISGENYEIGISYESQLLDTSFDELLLQFKDKDLAMQRTNAGIHKDDLEISLQGNSFKNQASQGQRKSLLFALKLAEFEALKTANGFPPLLLLDDLFEKLDQERMQNLLKWVCIENTGQLFITDTHCERLREQLNKLNVPCQLIELTNP